MRWWPVFSLMFLLRPCIGGAQSWDEFFKQKKTQERYLLEQLVALKVYAGYAASGYQTVHSGLGMIRQLTGGEFSIHDLFIRSLNRPGAAVHDNALIGRILSLQLRIREKLNGLSLAGLSEEQRQYVRSVRESVLEDCEKDLAGLALLMENGGLEMDDSERLQRLDRIFASLEDKWQFTVSFASGIRIMLLMKHQAGRNAAAAGKLHEIKN